jgi:aminoglycoside phosphotransferase (APT) family kinase protein
VSVAVTPTAEVLERFGLPAGARASLLGTGHIHRTWRIDAPGPVAVVQRVNELVFRDADALDSNLTHLEDVLVLHGVPTLRWRRTSLGELHHRDSAGVLWRSYDWVPGEVTVTVAGTAGVEALGHAFGRYAGALAGADPARFTTTIPGFHDFAARERAWRFAVLRDEARRFLRAQPEVERAARLLERLSDLPEHEAWGQTPQRIVHNDAKAANVVRDETTLTIIDLDTTMPGPLLADFGELVRTVCRGAPEDDDHAANALQTDRFGLLLRGWLAGYDHPLHPLEVRVLPIAGIVLTIENALRFLTDHLEGDLYFPVDRPDHNLARFRAQIGHAQTLLDGIDDLRRVAAHELQRRH